METTFAIEEVANCSIVRLQSENGANFLHRNFVEKLTAAIRHLASANACKPLIVIGNDKFFSAGADLVEISALNAAAAFDFAKMGQELMATLNGFPAATYAAISGYCMGGALDLALACRYRIASPSAIFGHRGAALGLITGWGGTQRLPRLIGKGRALEMFVAAEKIDAEESLRIGLIDTIVDDPTTESIKRATH